MINYLIKEEYDGRLPIYNVVEVDSSDQTLEVVLKSFDEIEQAEEYLKSLIQS